MKNIEDRPLSGAGFGRNAYILLNYEYVKKHKLLDHAHNVFLDNGIQMGIPGLLVFCLLLWSAFREVAQPLRKNCGDDHTIIYSIAGVAMLAGMIVKNLTDDFFYRDNVWMFWLIMAAVIGARKKTERLIADGN